MAIKLKSNSMRNYTVTKENLVEKAKRLGAVKCRIFCTKTRYSHYYGRCWEPMHYHYFDRDDNEIGYFTVGFLDQGLYLFNPARVWGDEFKTAEGMFECTPDESLNPQINTL